MKKNIMINIVNNKEMKNRILMLVLALCAVAFSAQSKSVLIEFKVEGQCGSCKKRIEKALDLPGISYASWDVNTKIMTVRYNDAKFGENDIHQIISELGYKTSKLSANKVSESKLPKCCQPGGVCKEE
ncbi:MAG: heavy-metal-associated domain-containing protein [Flavobacteriales bacterium]|nr:heavy-metal-associated domain-containing protein [Flavobacteriales bacterium]